MVICSGTVAVMVPVLSFVGCVLILSIGSTQRHYSIGPRS